MSPISTAALPIASRNFAFHLEHFLPLGKFLCVFANGIPLGLYLVPLSGAYILGSVTLRRLWGPIGENYIGSLSVLALGRSKPATLATINIIVSTHIFAPFTVCHTFSLRI